MKKMLKPRDILLLTLSGALDLFEELRDPAQLVSKSYENMYGWVPRQYKRHHFQHLVWRSLRTESIERIEKNGEVYLRLTSKGNEKIKRDFPLLHLQQKPWDRKWRIVVFDIEEIKKDIRDSLRNKLKELGCGMLQKSVFITPHEFGKDLAEFVENLGLGVSVCILEASRIIAGDKKDLARRVWKLDELNTRYEEIIEKIKKSYLTNTRDRVKKLNSLDGSKIAEIKEIKQEYLNVLLLDPFLPKELLPFNWKGEEAKRLVKAISRLQKR